MLIEEIGKGLSIADEIKLSDIPDINLYMEQVLVFLDSKLGHLKRGEDDKVFTKTMINNYTKAGLLHPPINKKYNKEHIILLALLYNLKNIFSISDIKSIFTPVLNDIANRADDIIPLEDIYSTYLKLKEDEFEEFYATFNEKYKLIKEKTGEIKEKSQKELAEVFLTVLMLTAQANAAKRLAEKIIDNHFKVLTGT
ncbi:protein of unknown function [Desulfotomaculum arcticum]|uniref:DUF1836 domain-containing protein n=1 Tax=Desulfotruncus arcticus DSM 17038 TaxID=1121424 RepID=A0A1I2SJY8_9FIRM|nr:DUF1836 domain-containing protein [Desulfotruncus arcticus]SFG50566.1 protein of unknown function [Desulfotomaculum arcticum] [Desulfotruncus arcticus DSM 17038]